MSGLGSRLARAAMAQVAAGVKSKWAVGLFLALVVLVVVLAGRGGHQSTSSADRTSVGHPGLLGASLGFDAPGSRQTATAGNGVGPPSGASAGDLTANGTSLLPVAESAGPGGTLTRYADASVTARHVFVVSAPVNKGFWLGSSSSDRVYVELIGDGLVYPHPVRATDRVSFTGRMVTNTDSFLRSTGLTPADGAAQLAAQGAHIAIPMNPITFDS